MTLADTNRGMIRYTSRDYNSILEDMKDAVPKLTELWSPDATADPGYVLMSLLASSADMLSVNLDWMSNEMYAPSVTQRKNAEKIFGLIGYTLGWYTAARTEVTFTNVSETTMFLDFGFNGANFCTLNAYTDITQQPRVITYNILPTSSSYGMNTTKSTRSLVTDNTNVFATSDRVSLAPGDSVTRVAVEGELRSCTVSVQQVKNNGYIIKLPSQHIDTRSIWLKSKATLHSDEFLEENWVQVESVAQFTDPEPRFAVAYDNYSNAQIYVSNYLNQMDNYDNNYLTVYWIECSGVIGSVSKDVLENFQPAIPASDDSRYNVFDAEGLKISNLSNTIELPHTYTVTGKSPETAKEAYFNSRNYINTWDSLITLPDYTRFLKRESGVDAATVIDCQKALEINLAIYHNTGLTDAQKSKQYINPQDFPIADTTKINFRELLDGVDTSNGYPFTVGFSTHTAMCYVVHNDFKDSDNFLGTKYADSSEPGNVTVTITDQVAYKRYLPPVAFTDAINDDFRPLQAMTTEIQFGYVRVFPWYVVGEIYPKYPLNADNAAVLIAKVKEALALYFAPANREFGQKPTVMEVVDVIQGADPSIRYFDAGSLSTPVINYGERSVVGGKSKLVKYDIDYFNPISFAKYQDVGDGENNIRIAPDYLIQ